MLEQAGDLECAADVAAGSGEEEAAVPEKLAGLDQRTQRRGVDELDLGEVDDDALGLRTGDLVQRGADLGCGVEVDLTHQSHNDVAVAANNTVDRWAPEPVRCLPTHQLQLSPFDAERQPPPR